MAERRLIVWNSAALVFLENALERIAAKSPKQAERVEEAVLGKLQEIVRHPERYPPDKYKKNNPGNFRAFEIHNFRISYRHNEQQIRVLRIRHTKQKPQNF
jgi:plasmid stabilization system protein ParE